MSYVEIKVETNIDVLATDILTKISDKDLINEVIDREIDISTVNLSFQEEEIIELLVSKKSIIEASRIKKFFNMQ